MVRFIPKTTKFFEMFSEMANNLTDGARLLKAILQDMKDVETRVEQLGFYSGPAVSQVP